MPDSDDTNVFSIDGSEVVERPVVHASIGAAFATILWCLAVVAVCVAPAAVVGLWRWFL